MKGICVVLCAFLAVGAAHVLTPFYTSLLGTSDPSTAAAQAQAQAQAAAQAQAQAQASAQASGGVFATGPYYVPGTAYPAAGSMTPAFVPLFGTSGGSFATAQAQAQAQSAAQAQAQAQAQTQAAAQAQAQAQAAQAQAQAQAQAAAQAQAQAQAISMSSPAVYRRPFIRRRRFYPVNPKGFY